MTEILQTLFDRRARFLAFVQGRVRSRELAEDILQAAYMRALEKSSDLREDESAVAWFYSVLRNAVTDNFRRSTTETSAMERLAKEWDESTPARDGAQALVCGCITHVLPSLRPAYAHLLQEVDLNEMPLAEFAAQHGLSANNAGVRAHRARAALKKELAKTCGACSLHACLDCVCKMPRGPRETNEETR